MDIQHLAYGWATPAAAYLMSTLGAGIGLYSASRIRTAHTPAWRRTWLTLAAVSLGCLGIWTMHFLAMLGYRVPGGVHYDPGLTAASAVLAIVAVGAGLTIATNSAHHPARVAAAGTITGLGVAAMHYTGMRAMHLHTAITYQPALVAASIALAVAASTAALWLGTRNTRPAILAAAAATMGLAVSAMHYTGMAAVTITTDHPRALPVDGIASDMLIVPALVVILAVSAALMLAMLAAPSPEDVQASQRIADLRQQTARR